MLVNLATLDLDVDYYMVLAHPENFTGRIIYKKVLPLLHEDAVPYFQKAVASAALAGLRLKIYDAFRPQEAQAILWAHTPDERYVMPPSKGSLHSRGAAIDLTLIDKATGKELDMGTPVDDFTEASHHHRIGLPNHVQRNRFLLLGIMREAGFDPIPTEWWHYQLNGIESYPLLWHRDLPPAFQFM